MKFKIFKDVSGQYRWRLRSANNEIIAVGESYINKKDLLDTIQLIKKFAPTAPIIDETIPKP